MSSISLQSDGRTWRFSPLPPVRDAARSQIIAQVQILDDASLSVPATPIKVTSDGPFHSSSGSDGLVGLVGEPTLALPDLQIAGTAVGFTVSAVGYRSVALNGVLPPQPAVFPAEPGVILLDKFQLLDFGQRRLIRNAVTIQGRVFRRIAGAFQPLPGATVAITAATQVPALAGATPLPVPVAGVGITAIANAFAEYRLPPVERFATLTLQVTAPVLGAPVVIVAPPAGSNVVQDFRL
ncbi:hypothetical protein [Bradyrhizobium niftali]|uniref:Uncharacterized protein n=1 Tax=Bradyrhizobium niftali TaxID=2560055 RepID=A0A4Y9M3N4_9BRAD|nr:hypothetical protein [Bradyrhizobium niftali]TFV49638.1 hypothetical protein E4K65_05405 [Bradyrhizobium niftali]